MDDVGVIGSYLCYLYRPISGRWQSQGQSQRLGQSQHKALPRWRDAKCQRRQGQGVA